MPIISFIVLTYNSENYIAKLLKSLKNISSDIRRVEVIVVDNNSSDKTRELIEKEKNVKFIKNKENFGFSKGINIGAAKASGNFLVFLNPDTEFKYGNFFEIIRLFEENEKTAVIGGKMIGEKGVEKSAGRFLKTWEIFLTMLGLDEAVGIREAPSNKKEVDFVSGGFMIVRRDIFQKLSGFDDNFFMYVEDMEFCYRVKMDGYKVVYCPEICVIHHSHGSSSRSFAIKNIYKGLLYFQEKHGNIFSRPAVRIMLKTKSILLVIVGEMLNNKYLSDTYKETLRI